MKLLDKITPKDKIRSILVLTLFYFVMSLFYLIMMTITSLPTHADTVQAYEGDLEYRVQAGDVLSISVWKEPDLQLEALVRPDSAISFPLIGNVRTGGKTVQEVADELAGKLEKFIPDPIVNVYVKQLSGNKFSVLGKVNRPGEFVMNRPTDVMQALAAAGGMTPFADENDIVVLRRNGDEQVAIGFKYGEVQRGKELKQNIVLLSGDVVVVP